MSAPRHLVGKTIAQIVKCDAVDILVGTCNKIGLLIPDAFKENVNLLRRELTRRIIAQTLISAHPERPTKIYLNKTILLDKDDYLTLLDNRFQRVAQKKNNIHFTV